MITTFTGRLYPTRAQDTRLRRHLDIHSAVYSAMLCVTQASAEPVSYYQLTNYVRELKRSTMPELAECTTRALNETALRLDRAWLRYYKGLAGPPSAHKTISSIGYIEYRAKLTAEGLFVPGVGRVKYRGTYVDPSMFSRFRTLNVRIDTLGRWHYAITARIRGEPPKRAGLTVVGIDLGLATFATLSTGEKLDPPVRNAAQRRERRRLRRRQEDPSAYLHHCRKWRRRRRDWMHKTTRALVDRWDIIVIEKLDISRMIRENRAGRQIARAGWGLFLNMLRYKAERAGVALVEVNPAHTSADCYICGWRHDLTLRDREFECLRCGCGIDRDVGAARNILRRGLA